MKKKQKTSLGRKLFLITNALIMTLVILVTLYPFLYMLAMSFSEVSAIMSGEVTIYPVGFNFDAYKTIVQQKSFWIGYRNTIMYTVLGTIINLFMTMICAYPLSKKDLPFRKPILMFMVFTMYFGGGLIPHYLLMVKLKMINSIFAIVIPGAISTYNMLVMRTFFLGIPEGLEEAAQIDGLGHIQVLFRIVLPLSKPVIATIGLFSAVYLWNDWFSALLYLHSATLQPVTLFLRNVVMGATLSIKTDGVIDPNAAKTLPQTLRSATIMLVTVPILCVYPFIQKYFVKGVMIGSVKE